MSASFTLVAVGSAEILMSAIKLNFNYKIGKQQHYSTTIRWPSSVLRYADASVNNMAVADTGATFGFLLNLNV
jgi:hypothetical protein